MSFITQIPFELKQRLSAAFPEHSVLHTALNEGNCSTLLEIEKELDSKPKGELRIAQHEARLAMKRFLDRAFFDF